MGKTKRKNKSGKVYKPEGIRYFGAFIILIVLAFHFYTVTLLWKMSSAWLCSVLVLPLYAFAFWSLIIEASQMTIIIYDDGLEYRRGGSRLFTTWDNMSRLGRRGTGRSLIFGIYLHNQVQPEIKGLIESLLYNRPRDYIALNGIVNVPTRWEGLFEGTIIDLNKFANTEFGRDLMHYAPHLFEKGKM